MSRIESDPRGCKHEVDMSIIFVAPVFEHLLKVELADNLVGGQHGVHVGTKPQVSVYASLIKLDLDKAVRVGSNNEIDFGPVNHDNLLDIVYNVRELLLRHTLHAAIHLCRLELSGQYFIVLNPLGAKNVFFAHLIRVIQAQERCDVVLQSCIIKEAVLELP